MSWLSSFRHPSKGYKAAQDELQKYNQQAQSFIQPYNNAGIQQYGNLQSYIDNLMNPGRLNDDWLNNYHESQSAKNAEDRANEHGLNAASSMGLLGSNTALNAIQSGVSQIGADDQQAYLDNMMQKYLNGANIASNIFNQGSNSANLMSNNSMNTGNNMAQMKFAEKNAPGDLFGKLLGSGAGLAAGVAGSALSGPLGGLAATALAKKWNLSGGAN